MEELEKIFFFLLSILFFVIKPTSVSPFRLPVGRRQGTTSPCCWAPRARGHLAHGSVPPTEKTCFLPPWLWGCQPCVSMDAPPGAAAGLMWMDSLEKAEGKGGKRKHNPLNSQLRNLLLGRWCSHHSEFHILLTYLYSYGCTECGVCLHPLPAQWREVSAINKYIRKWMNKESFRAGPGTGSRMEQETGTSGLS